jgi:hypothetical protein
MLLKFGSNRPLHPLCRSRLIGKPGTRISAIRDASSTMPLADVLQLNETK